MKKLLLLFSLFAASSVFAQIDPNQLMAGLKQNEDPNRLDSIAKSLNYKGGELVAVFAKFTIDENGEVTNISAKGPHPAFEQEAIRIVKKLPKFDPAMYNGKPLARRFTLPIKFRIETEREKKKRLKKEKKVRDRALKR